MERRLRQALTLYAFAALGVFLVVTPWTVIWDHAVASFVPESLAAGLLTVRAGGRGAAPKPK